MEARTQEYEFIMINVPSEKRDVQRRRAGDASIYLCARMTESDEVRERGRQEMRVYDFRMDQARADAAPVSASIFGSSLRSAP